MPGTTRSRFFLGVDGGQSSTTALIGDVEGRVLGLGRGGPCNHVGVAEGRDKFIRAIEESLGGACAQAGVDRAKVQFHSACLGFSGGPSDKEAILHDMVSAEQMLVTHDALIALSGAIAGEPGIVVIAGTGSMAFGRNAQGDTARAGGWGYLFGDEGGGFDLSRQALRAALRMEEGWGAPTMLRDMLLEQTGAADANDLLHRFYTAEFPRPRIAGFSKLVDQGSRRGDEVARELLRRAAADLGTLVVAVHKQLFEASPTVAYVGGVFRSEMLLKSLKQSVERLRPPVYGPAAGALIEAYRAAGLPSKLSGVPDIEK